jgi:hypothetical protein
VCSTWRWRVAAQALGIGIGLPASRRAGLARMAPGDPPEYRRVGAKGRSRCLGLRFSWARRGHRGHDRHSLCRTHADRSCPGPWPAPGRRRSRHRDQGQRGDSKRPDPAP